MIISKLQGGLSNQMFQYAAAKRLAMKHKTELKLDINWYNNIPKDATSRRFELDFFSINASFATENDLIGTNGIRNTRLKHLPIALYRKFYPKARYIGEKHFHFDRNILNLPDNVCLHGYWVSEKYFKDIEETIRNEFKFLNEPNQSNKQIILRINSTESVALHIRRGDYVSNLSTNNIHGICSMEYYEKSIKYVTSKISNPIFFIFSDDINWAKQNFDIAVPKIYIEENRSVNNFEDLRLISLCKHQIIANSGFSWWGAWLNPNKQKIICAPEKWFNTRNYDTKDVIPSDWIKF